MSQQQHVTGIIFHSHSEKIMGSFSLQPDMAEESAEMQLQEGFLKQLLEKYCCKVKVTKKRKKNKIFKIF